MPPIIFLLRRWWRIYPPYLTSVLLVFLAALFRKVTAGVNDVSPVNLTFESWIATLLVASSLTSLDGPRNWVYWSLTCEVVYYFAIAACIAVKKTSLELALVVVTLFFTLLGTTGVLEPISMNWWQFALGATLATDTRKRVSQTLMLLCFATAIAQSFQQGFHAPAAAIVAWASIAWSKSKAGAWLNRERIFSQIGVYSYSLYLTHVPIGVYLLLHLRPAEAATNWVIHLLSDFAVYFGCLVFAWSFWKVIENPSHKIGKRIAL